MKTSLMSVFGVMAAMLQVHATDSSSTVWWVSAVAAGVGFLLGSVPPRGANRGWEFDMPGAVLWAVSAGLICGGLASGLSTGAWLPALVAAGLGIALGGARIVASLPPRVPQNNEVNPGVTRVEGDTVKAKFKAAKRLFNNASFRSRPDSNYFATRGLKEFWYGSGGGMPAYDLETLSYGLAGCQSDTFDILVLLVDRLPTEENQPAVIVVRGVSELRKVLIGKDYIEVPEVGKIDARWVAGMVGYAWR